MASIFDQPDVTVMTYNLKNGADIPHWERRKDRLVDVIRQAAPTILGTQEGYEYQLAYLRDNLQHYDVYGEGRKPFIGDEYVAVFVDRRVATVTDSGTFWLSDTPDVPGSRMGDEHLPRIATWVRMTIHDTPLLYVNTHLTYIEEGIPAQIGALTKRLAELIDPDVETILTGDFNIGRHRDPIAPLRAMGFEDVWSFAHATHGAAITFPDWPLWDTEALNALADENRIDWVLVRPANGENLPATLHVDVPNTHTADPTPSDHFPVIVHS